MKKPRKTKADQLPFDAPPPLKEEPAEHRTASIEPRTPNTEQRAANVEPLQEYTRLGSTDKWRVNRFDLMAAELSVDVEHLPRFHQDISVHTRSWMICRRLFGICPLIPPMTATEDDLRTWSREELYSHLGLTKATLGEELEKVRGLWIAVFNQLRAAAEQAEAQRLQALSAAGTEGELHFKSYEILKRFGFDELLSADEQEWFAQRVEDSVRLLEHQRAGELVRASLLNELEMRRINSLIARNSRQMRETNNIEVREALRKEYDYLFKTRNQLNDSYQKQLAKIDEIFPWMSMVKGNMTMRGVFSEAVSAHAEFYSKGTHQIADGIFSAAEIQILLRTSVQAPEPQYRVGLITYLNMARQHLWDMNWRGQYPPLALKKLDQISKKAAMEISEAESEELTDLQSDDPLKGEYPAVYLPEEEKRNIEQPTSNAEQ